LHAQGEGPAQYFYDDLSRPTRVVDPNGNIARHSYNAVLASRRVLRDADNQLTQFGPSSLAYDANGNLTSDGTNTYTWSARNQLISISGGVSANFQYDAFGRRVSKTVAGTTQYLYDGVNLVQELSGNVPTAKLLSVGVDFYLARTDSSGAASLLDDGLGSTLALVGGSSIQYTYEPFGRTSASGASNNPYQFTGRENDETGLYFYRARYYSPTLQRFISEDPAGFSGGDANLYAYVRNSPINQRDSSGKNPACLIGGLIGSIGYNGYVIYESLAGRKAAYYAGWSGLGHILQGNLQWFGAGCLVGSGIGGLAGAGEGAAGGLTEGAVNDPNAWPGWDPATPPDDGEPWVWRGNGPPGSGQGSWVNPDTGESLHPDLSHPDPIVPHWDYTDPAGNDWRVFPNGDTVPK
jgi:RHS repeat-associated protein